VHRERLRVLLCNRLGELLLQGGAFLLEATLGLF
jgi:hypothetical protein